jgi:hypothetical protein
MLALQPAAIDFALQPCANTALLAIKEKQIIVAEAISSFVFFI